MSWDKTPTFPALLAESKTGSRTSTLLSGMSHTKLVDSSGHASIQLVLDKLSLSLKMIFSLTRELQDVLSSSNEANVIFLTCCTTNLIV